VEPAVPGLAEASPLELAWQVAEPATAKILAEVAPFEWA